MFPSLRYNLTQSYSFNTNISFIGIDKTWFDVISCIITYTMYYLESVFIPFVNVLFVSYFDKLNVELVESLFNKIFRGYFGILSGSTWRPLALFCDIRCLKSGDGRRRAPQGDTCRGPQSKGDGSGPELGLAELLKGLRAERSHWSGSNCGGSGAYILVTAVSCNVLCRLPSVYLAMKSVPSRGSTWRSGTQAWMSC